MAAATALDEPAPDIFVRAVDQLRSQPVLSTISISETTAPARIAPYAFALSAEIDSAQAAFTQSRLILLHDPVGHDSWEGSLRLVTYLSVEVDTTMAHDPMMSPVTWSWLVDSLRDRGAEFSAAGGTVTCTASTRFGDLRRPRDFAADAEASLELRASWTPLDANLAAHAQAWHQLVATAAGLPPQQ